MKKLLKIGAYVGIVLVIIMAVDFTVGYYTPDNPDLARKSVYDHFNVSSESMDPTLIVGESYRVEITNETPKIGDMIEFQCLKEDCDLHGVANYDTIIHRLTAIDAQGCMTIIGDNPKYDWSKVPCYMPEDIKIIGVVKKLDTH